MFCYEIKLNGSGAYKRSTSFHRWSGLRIRRVFIRLLARCTSKYNPFDALSSTGKFLPLSTNKTQKGNEAPTLEDDKSSARLKAKGFPRLQVLDYLLVDEIGVGESINERSKGIARYNLSQQRMQQDTARFLARQQLAEQQPHHVS